MRFRTEISLTPLAERIDHSAKIFALGSCFAESISERLLRSKFSVATNPFGVLFNPLSIANAIERLSDTRAFAVCDIREGREGFSPSMHTPRSMAKRIPRYLQTSIRQWRKARRLCMMPSW